VPTTASLLVQLSVPLPSVTSAIMVIIIDFPSQVIEEVDFPLVLVLFRPSAGEDDALGCCRRSPLAPEVEQRGPIVRVGGGVFPGGRRALVAIMHHLFLFDQYDYQCSN
jgi:hypothetical protein